MAMRLISLFCALALSLLPAAATASGFVYNAQTWLALPPQAKQAYAQGINDAANYVYVTDDVGAAVVKFARTQSFKPLVTGFDERKRSHESHVRGLAGSLGIPHMIVSMKHQYGVEFRDTFTRCSNPGCVTK